MSEKKSRHDPMILNTLGFNINQDKFSLFAVIHVLHVTCETQSNFAKSVKETWKRPYMERFI